MARPTTKRCAIYTRKSSEEGLEQEYNSLDAQRDAAEAFIRSQKHEGWKPLPEAYNDGGISGGHMERPGLQKLIRDIESGKIDVVVVYKVDRLSRSLADFAQLMKLFDKHEVSFVSVTQQFNTSSSMGRLTLNVLLSFAQFEREVTGERIRDKIALSKKKGMWMGGIPPLGYDAVGGKLIINPTEAEVVTECFRIYLESSGLIEAVQKLNSRGLGTKAFISKKGKESPSKPWVAKQLHRTLTLSIYRGMIPHKGQIFVGEHAAIIDEALWEEVQQKLRENQPGNGKGGGHVNEMAIQQTQLLHPLRGFVYTIDGHALTPTYTNKSSKGDENGKVRKRYRYYVSQQAIRQGYQEASIKTLNADLLENAVRQILAPALPKLADVVASDGLTTDQLRHRLENHASQIIGLDSPMELARMIQFLEPKIVVASDKIQIHLMHDRVGKLAAEHMDAPRHPISQDRMLNPEITFGDEEVVVSSSLSLTLQRGRSQVVDRENGVMLSVRESAPNSALIQTIVQAEYWRAQLQNQPDKSLVEILAPHGIQPNYVRRLLNAAYLAPEIKRAIFQGTQPVGMQVQDLIKLRSRDWTVQKRELGFA